MSRAVAIAAACTVALVLVEAVAAHGGHALLGAFAAVGVIGALVLGLGAKTLGHALQRPAADDQDRWEDER